MKQQSEKAVQVHLTGKHYQTIYRKSDDSYCVALYTVDKGKDTVTVVGANLPEVDYPVTFSGKWVTTKKYGKQFDVDMIINMLPEARHDIAKYISSLKTGIGVTRAEKMLDMVGVENFWDELKNDPAQFCAIKGVRMDSLVELQTYISKQSTQSELFQLFGADLACSGRQYKQICNYFKSNLSLMLESIRENPFVLMKCGYDFAELDYYSSRHTGFPVNDFRRLLAAAQQVLLDARSKSHVGLPGAELMQAMGDLLRKQGYVSDEDIQEFLDSLTVSDEAIVFSNDLYYLARSYQEETKIAEVISEMAMAPAHALDNDSFDAAMKEYAAQKGFGLSSDQQKAVKTALERSICIITGGPGTGKSTILDAILFCWKKFRDDKWMLMAPTGKAAVRMTETTEQPATTIHSSLGLNVGNDNPEEMDTWVADINASLIVVDECSMIDQTVMASMSLALKKNNGKDIQHLVLVGDPEQLPSVGAGNILADCIDAGTIPVCRLATIYRQGAESPIITNSSKIRNGESDLLCNAEFRRFNAKRKEKPDEFDEYGNPVWETQDEANMRLIVNCFLSNIEKNGPDSTVILSPYHKATAISTNALNKRIQEAVNPNRGQGEIKAYGRIYRVGDKVMQLKNTDVLSNGDIGIITYVEPHASETDPCVLVKFENGFEQSYVREELAQVEHAWAISIHKSQGSQWPNVLIVMPEKFTSFLKRNILYTAITRSQKNIGLFGPQDTIAKSIQNCKKDERYTKLVLRLRSKAAPAPLSEAA